MSYVVELMHSMGPVYAKRMFGGYGIYLDSIMFALIADNMLYFKVDKETETAYKDKGLTAFTYSRQGKVFAMSYYQAPEETLEDSDEMNVWANLAYQTAVKSAVKNKNK